jgi:hypothetical protein
VNGFGRQRSLTHGRLEEALFVWTDYRHLALGHKPKVLEAHLELPFVERVFSPGERFFY